MTSSLIVSRGEKSIVFLKEILEKDGFKEIIAVDTNLNARKTLSDHTFDLVIINAASKDENAFFLARQIAKQEISQVILLVAEEDYDEFSLNKENRDVLTISKPLNRSVFWSALKFARYAHQKLIKIREENNKLKQEINDIRLIDRAKCILISYLGMNENEAHKYIEKQAMDMRETKTKIAKGILKTYEY